MKLCKRIEQREPDVDSSYHPLRFQQTETSGLNKTRPSQFLPVHYFDYIGKSSCIFKFSYLLTACQLGLLQEGLLTLFPIIFIISNILQINSHHAQPVANVD
jgi:hypothetical protein